MSIASDLVSLTTDIAKRIAIPAIRHVCIPKSVPKDKRAVFGLLALADDSSGFFYMRLGDVLERFKATIDPQQLIGRDVMEVVTWFDSDDDLMKPLGLGAINAVSQHVLRLADYRLEATANSMGAFAFKPTDHVGMVGFFASLVNRLSRQGIPVTVIEKKPELVQTAAAYTVTLDPTALSTCTHILCTASTLLNDTLDDILSHCQATAHVALIGPSAGCLPDPLFTRGVDIVGGSVVRDFPAVMHRVLHNRPWGNAVEKYTLQKADYPGIVALQERL